MNKMMLVQLYQQRPQVNEMFAEKSEALRKAAIPEATVLTNNKFLPKILGPALAALYTIIGVPLVLAEDIKLGVFLATISVFGDICGAFVELFGLYVDVVSTFGGIQDLTGLLNLPTDLKTWQAVNRQRRRKTVELRAKLLEQQNHLENQNVAQVEYSDRPFVPAADQMPIVIENLNYRFPGSPKMMFENVNLQCSQGQICEIRHGAG